MRSRKTTGGLTCRSGISLSTIVKRVRSIPAPSGVINAIETFGGVAYATSDRHVDLRKSSRSRDIPKLCEHAQLIAASVARPSYRISGRRWCGERKARFILLTPSVSDKYCRRRLPPAAVAAVAESR